MSNTRTPARLQQARLYKVQNKKKTDTPFWIPSDTHAADDEAVPLESCAPQSTYYHHEALEATDGARGIVLLALTFHDVHAHVLDRKSVV